MSLFKRKPEIDDAVRCPSCRERVPQGAAECAMCGRDLRDLDDAGGAERERVAAQP
jgi:DNA-directed RNA polymerase subunit RPC12/RpoP